MHCIVFGFGLARNIENENNNLGRRREKGITPDQLPLFLDMARLCNSVFYPNERYVSGTEYGSHGRNEHAKETFSMWSAFSVRLKN